MAEGAGVEDKGVEDERVKDEGVEDERVKVRVGIHISLVLVPR